MNASAYGILRRYLLPRIASAVLILTAAGAAIAGTQAQWAWMSGEQLDTREPVYGTRGVGTAITSPGVRNGAATCTDSAGNFWLFGGSVYLATDNGLCNDVWMYDRAAHKWTWKGGQDTQDNIGSYGTIGTTNATNHPGSRTDAQMWAGNDGALYIFGGTGFDTTGPEARLNDLWKFNPTNGAWTWLHGSTSAEVGGVYGTIKQPAAANTPGARASAATWKDSSGTFWMLGGDGFGFSSASSGLLNDLWKYDVASNRWTWMHGSKSTGAPAVPGEIGVAADNNTPGGLSSPFTWLDSAGNLWLFGGFGTVDSNYATLDVVWKYSPSTARWTWVKGTHEAIVFTEPGSKGEAAVGNTPGGRYGGSAWKDTQGHLWLYGGAGWDYGPRGDWWQFDTATTLWTWMGGVDLPYRLATTGASGIPDAATDPGTRYEQLSWDDGQGNLWMYGGSSVSPHTMNLAYYDDLWKFDGAAQQWAWLSGGSQVSKGVYGAQGTAAAGNTPGAREDAMAWTTPDGTIWLFGGLGVDSNRKIGRLNDLWKYNPATRRWTWVRGSTTINTAGSYGTQGNPIPSNNPGSRSGSITWVDATGKLWLFGGFVYRQPGGNVRMADLWRYDPGADRWTWMHGGRFNQDVAVFGEKGAFAATNVPGARQNGVGWTDSDGNLWLFGGTGTVDTDATTGLLNDLWKFDISLNQWAWMGGTKLKQQRGAYGAITQLGAANVPGGRESAVGWRDNAGNLWLFGGRGYSTTFSGDLNDLWKYNIAAGQWAWMSGSHLEDQYGTYGDLGTADAGNTPGSRSEAMAWTDGGGIFHLMGGKGYGESASFSQPLGDLWSYNPTSGQWTWESGSNEVEELPIFGALQQTTAAATPGARYSAAAWSLPDAVWIFGGKPVSQEPQNDLWRFGTVQTAAHDWQLFD